MNKRGLAVKRNVIRALASALLFSFLVPASLTGCSERITQTPDLSSYVILEEDAYLAREADLGSYIRSQGQEYGDCHDLPVYLTRYKLELFWDMILSEAEIDWSRMPLEEITAKEQEWRGPARAAYERALQAAESEGKTLSYKTFGDYALAYFGVNGYSSFDTYVRDMAKEALTELAILQLVVGKLGTLPTDEELRAEYNAILTAFFTDTNAGLSKVEGAELYKSEKEFLKAVKKSYGERYLWDSAQRSLLLEKLASALDEHWNFKVPELSPEDAPVFDRTSPDLAALTVSKERTTLVRLDIETADGALSGSVYIRLYPQNAYRTVANFQYLVETGFYNGTVIHYTSSALIQGGGYDATGNVKYSDSIMGEFFENGVGNHLSHTRGTVSMARNDGNANSAQSEFFICRGDNYAERLNGKYAAFGYVVHGMELVDSIAALATTESGAPIRTVVIKSATFVTES